ncbi:hypothetical protein EMIHUDRAFT_230137 [Emiliania huxleyi CCMP1516]|uniref:Uncharacterized protein n=2 Tax=Emiliania huxleyi TaxID=2903 RepID=A0A0D3KB33_EMIH1|nr:hypothetical protein EMIHUDRAFT_230137 [Emiliania huxleyi CCMP1516]EOD32968.1 hypothetical protein EMIHUDRAFT_230137 [Emiliania huxleyi CCMP1516]|eukprot:XP_005785397.1 hypothetical protein EMIHUDRAFT_230137 [Emiliania huxleyi CCMP1516]
MPAASSLRRLLSAPFAVTPRCAIFFRRWVALLVLLEAASRWDALRWLYTDSGALPRRLVLPDPAEDPLAWAVCAHAWHGSLAWAQALTALQASAAVGLFFGARGAGVLAWWLHLSACLRVPPLIFILDRYLHLLLAFAVLLPTPPPSGGSSLASLLLAALRRAAGAAWRGGGGPGCGSRATPGVLWRALLHNRWDVFASAEEHVVWEIAPARLSDGAVVDLWRGTEEVSWAVPEEEAPAHGGRWRSLPLTAERGEDEEAQFWGALCDEWEARERERSGSEDDFETLFRAQLARMGYDASALPPGTGAQVAAVAHDGFHGNLQLPVGIDCIEARVKVVEAGMAKPMNWGALTPAGGTPIGIKELSALERELAALKKPGAEARKEAADAAAAAAGGLLLR